MKAFELIIKNNQAKSLPKQFNPDTYAYQYLLGVLAGDGSICGNRAFVLGVKDNDFRKKFILLGNYLGFSVKSYKPKTIKTSFGKTIQYRACIYILNFCNRLQYDTKNIIVSKGFLEGFFDSEGTVCMSGTARCVRVTNRNGDILKKIKYFLNKNNIKPCFFINHGQYILQISDKNSLIKLHRHFHFSIKRKQDRLDAIVKSYKK